MMSQSNRDWPSVGGLAAPLVAALVDDAPRLRILASRSEGGATIVDAGIACPGGIEAGLRIADICMAGLGRTALVPDTRFPNWPWMLTVHTANPVLACLGSQYAGWSLSHEAEGGKTFHALGSGPGRALAAREKLFGELGYRDRSDTACLVLEVDRMPPAGLVAKIATDCGVDPRNLTLILTPTRSLAGTVQVVARVLEVALHKVHELGFPLERVVDGVGSAPLPPPAPDFVTAMGRTNDAILFGGDVQLFVSGDDAAARDLAAALPSSSSKDYGRPFAETFKAYKGDFFAIDPMLFSPARVTVTALDSGNSFHAGKRDEALLDLAFGAAGGG